MDIENKILRNIQSLLERRSGSILTVNTEALSTPSKLKEIRSIDLMGRIPSKKFELVVLELINTDTIDEKRISKYISKSTKYFLIFNNSFSVKNLPINVLENYSHIFISPQKSQALNTFQSYLSLAANRKEFLKQTHDIESYINNNFRKLGFLHIDNNDGILIGFANKELMSEFVDEVNSKINQETINYFNTYVLKKYAAGIDTLNARFKNNALFIAGVARNAGQSFANNVIKTRRDIKTNWANIKRQIQRNRQTAQLKKAQEKKIVVEKEKQVITRTSRSLNTRININRKAERLTGFAKQEIDSLNATLQLRNFPISPKFTTYDDYLKNENKAVSKIAKQRALQKIKNNIKFSLIMVVSDIDEIWLNKSVRAIKDQSYTNWELIVIDNCSPRTYLKSYLSSLNDPRIKTYFFNSKKTYAECLSHGVYKISTGDFIGIIEEGDELDINTLLIAGKQLVEKPDIEVLYTDEDMINEQGKRIHPLFKPNWDTTLIMSYPFLNHIFFVRREIIERVDAFKSISINEPVWDLLLRIKDSTHNIFHIDRILYHKRIRPLQKIEQKHIPSDALKAYIDRETLQSNIIPTPFPGAYEIIKKNLSQEKVSIIVFEKNIEAIDNFIKSFRPTHQNIELIIGTEKPPEEIKAPFPVIFYKVMDFNFSKDANNIIQNVATGNHILLYDSRMRYVTPDFIQYMLSYSIDNNIVGTLITDPDNFIENGIFAIGTGKPVGIVNEGAVFDKSFYLGTTQKCSGVSKKCLIAKKEIFINHPLNEKLSKSYQDIDFCLNCSQDNITTVYIPNASQKSTFAYIKSINTSRDTVEFVKRWKSLIYTRDRYIPSNYNIK